MSSSGPNVGADDEEVQEYVYKILVVGDLACGKTSLIHRYVNHTFSTTYRATIGVDFALKTLNWDPKTSIRLQLWDIAGQERFGHMTRVYYKEAVGAFVVFDVTREKTFQAVVKWKADIDENLQNIPCVLLANKCDLAEGPIDKEMMDHFCKEHRFIGWFQTSAKENINVEEAGRFLVEHILKSDPKALLNRNQKPDGLVDFNKPSAQKENKEGCSC